MWLTPTSLAYSISLSILFYSLVHLQCRTMQRRRTGWRLMTGLVTWWHTKATLSKIPLRGGTCVTVQPCLQPFLWSRVSLWLSPPPAITIKLPSAVGTRVFLSLSELIPHRSFSFVRYADRVSLLTPLCFTLATGTKVLLFSEEMYWKYDSHLFPKLCPLCPRPPDENSIFLKSRKTVLKECMSVLILTKSWIIDLSADL